MQSMLFEGKCDDKSAHEEVNDGVSVRRGGLSNRENPEQREQHHRNERRNCHMHGICYPPRHHPGGRCEHLTRIRVQVRKIDEQQVHNSKQERTENKTFYLELAQNKLNSSR